MTRTFLRIALALPVLLCVQAVAIASDLLENAATLGGAKTFVAAARSSGLSDALKENGPYTVFAPDDAAFAKLPASTRDALMRDKSKLAHVLAYHVIPGKVTVAEIKPGNVETLEGDTVKITSDNGKVTVNDANVTQSDVEGDDGVVHIIDTVILPKD